MSSYTKVFCGMFAVMALLSACQKKQTTPPQQRPAPLTVGALKTAAHDVPLTFEYTGKAQGSKETEVRARVGGILMKRNFVEGSFVEQGQVLFEIDRKPFKIALDKAQANLAKQTADLKAAEHQWERVKTLGEKGFASRKSQDDAEARVLSTRADIAAAKAALDDARLNYDYTLVTAPISGITSMEAHSEGSLISTTGENALLTTVSQLDPIYVVFSVSDNDLFSLREQIDKGLVKNPKGTDSVNAKLIFSDGTAYDAPGTIDFINPAVDQTTGTLKLRAVFKNADKKIIPGQFLRVGLEGLVRQSAIVLPKSAVLQGTKGSFVYVVGTDGKVAVKPVKTGYSTQNGDWIIDEGLTEGEIVILDNFVKIKPTMTVVPRFEQKKAETAETAQQAS